MFIYPIYNHNWRNISTVYTTSLASNEIFSPSNKIHREVGRAKDLSAPRYWLPIYTVVLLTETTNERLQAANICYLSSHIIQQPFYWTIILYESIIWYWHEWLAVKLNVTWHAETGLTESEYSKFKWCKNSSNIETVPPKRKYMLVTHCQQHEDMHWQMSCRSCS